MVLVGDHCTGDGIKFAMRDAGADAIDLKWVQVHPTGLVNPKEPDYAQKNKYSKYFFSKIE